tara:strand:+ start:1729 stop:1854 length:126 start_codon:yes stop_codon:yes gene_type:complete
MLTGSLKLAGRGIKVICEIFKRVKALNIIRNKHNFYELNSN